ncbi:MAG: PAS domain S-box protein [Planctomycetota bacterium]
MHDDAKTSRRPAAELLLSVLQRANLAAVESQDTAAPLIQLLQGLQALLEVEGIAVFATPFGGTVTCLATAGDGRGLGDCCERVITTRSVQHFEEPRRSAFPLDFGGRTIGVLAFAPNGAWSAETDDRVFALVPVLAGWVRLQERLQGQRAMLDGLRGSERRYRSLVEVCNELIQSVDADGRILFVNAEWRRALHLDGVSVEGRSIYDFLHPDSLERCREAFAHAFAGKVLRGLEVAFRNHLGDKVVVEGDVLPQVVDGAVVSTQAFFRDVTQQRASEAERAWSTALLDQVVEGSPEAMVFLGLDERVQRVNPEFTRLFGYTPREAIGRRIDELVVPASHVLEGRDYCRRAAHAEVVNIETVRRRKDGSEFAVSLLATPIQLGGRQVATLCIYRDISERKRLEASLARAQRMEAVGRLAGGISHDFNNLLTVINATTDMLLEEVGLDSSARKDLDEIARAGERAATLTRQLLAFSRKQVLQPVVMNLNDVVHEVAKMLSRLIGEDIRLVVRASPDLGCVKADPTQIEQVLLNLALNARDAMPRGGHLTIATQDVLLDAAQARELGLQPGTYVELTVEDTGCGIPAHELDLIFEPFWSTKAADGRGTGLGLSTVYGIVQQSDGAITVKSELGNGSRFRVLLPRDAGTVPEQETSHTAPRQGFAETVLVVEDDQVIRSLVERALKNAGYLVLVASNAADALSLLDRHGDQIALLFTDVVMPEISGPELAARMRAVLPKLRVLFTSGYADDRVFEMAGALDSTHFLPKPYTFSSLAGKVREVLDT